MGILYNQVADRIQALIREGVYREGDRLPGVRVLSRQFGVSVSTILQAHQTLEARGYLQARERSGYFVRRPARELPEPNMPRHRSRPVPVSAREMTLDLCADEQKRMVPLATAIPHPDFLPLRQIQQSTLWAARRGLETLDYAFPGKLEFRRQVAQRMAAIGVPVSPDEVLATNGAQEAIILALRAVTQPGDIVAVESPSFPGILQALEVVGLRVIEIPTHPSEGLSLEGLQVALEQWPLKACVVVTNHSNPMGARMPDARKRQLVSMLAAAGVPLIEDDIYGDLYYAGERPRPAKAFDQADNVIYCSSFSKTVSPGLRLGWMIPGRYMAGARQHKYFVNLATSTIPQLAVAHFLEQGGYDRYLRAARQHYRDASERLRAAVARAFPEGTAVSRPQGGFVLWVQLPDGVSGTEVFQRARAENINVAPGRMFSTTDKFENCLRLNAGNPWTATIENAVTRLGTLVQALAGR
ncbi:PLP-dependent aminotransferase family protein [Marinobacter lutaoensis]|jgi:DNA-binding transcriptional MocR family regulator|uniref:GntR family transcriptional regulator n=1 Tax=Marinobacter lutaoensis TaxID=135739 RepID=A0A1V2DT05_9GAMM|nr:PLP-dependent aminotransferase family protein [Marinobacter lutaoensis]MBI42220.1 PLP-dependent aminotransferase family protein [Oceanospirillales bacterium]NVD36424.1 PLP-dependent aminotransferase family protein [Marinobacter lutaoensis]ONF43707.1 GntR family transcriptional regulator [Marinobacter lutaoensis]|tara:strand:- start:213 stop:1622 length:1410 start_codon:yes stop_codon:yes gene_type:complete